VPLCLKLEPTCRTCERLAKSFLSIDVLKSVDSVGQSVVCKAECCVMARLSGTFYFYGFRIRSIHSCEVYFFTCSVCVCFKMVCYVLSFFFGRNAVTSLQKGPDACSEKGGWVERSFGDFCCFLSRI